MSNQSCSRSRLRQPYLSVKPYGDGNFALIVADGPEGDYSSRSGFVFRSHAPMTQSDVDLLRQSADEAQRILDLNEITL